MQSTMHVYEVRPRKNHRGVDLISDVLPFGRLWYDTPDNAIGYAMHLSRSHHAMIRVYDDAGNVIEAHEQQGRIKAPCAAVFRPRHLRMVRSTCIKIVKGVNHASENR
jgi:hypothetical protein